MMKHKTTFRFKLIKRAGLLLVLSGLLTGFICQRPFTGKQEARGVWLSRWEFTMNLTNNTALAQQQKIREAMHLARAANLNFVFFQVRGQCDAFYRSKYEPWAAELTGSLGQDPQWDPLQLAVEAAHQNGLELHAWINTFTCWKGTEPPPFSNPEHIYHQHPEWFCADKLGKPMSLNEHYLFLSPGIPAVREYVRQVALDLVQNYEIDGIHFDYIRYPEKANELGYSHDPISVKRHESVEGNPDKLSWEAWQREQVNIFIREFYQAALKIKPALKISAAVFGNADTAKTGARHTVFQDGKQWLRENSVDFLVPMIYWHRQHPTAAFERLAQDWLFSTPTERFILPGLAAYKYNRPEWPADEIKQQVAFIRRMGASGMAFFSYTALREMLSVGNYRFDYPAIAPPLPWKEAVPPNAPPALRIQESSSQKVTLTWTPPAPATDGDLAQRFIIYRTNSPLVDIRDARNVLNITLGADSTVIDSSVVPGRNYYYLVSALDENNNESPVSQSVAVQIPAATLAQK